MTLKEYRAFLVRNQKQMKFESEEDEGAMMYHAEVQSVIDAIDQGRDVRAAANSVGVDYLVSSAPLEVLTHLIAASRALPITVEATPLQKVIAAAIELAERGGEQ